MSVFVVDTNKTPLAPYHEAKARKLLDAGKAAIFRMRPFTIILKRAVESPQVPDLRVKLDPGSRTTGIAVVDDESGKVVFAAELVHRGYAIKQSLDSRRATRRSRRARHTRYRAARWHNRRRKEGWLPPSLQSRIANVLTWVAKLTHLCWVTAISMELVKFDMQLMENPEISGVEYHKEHEQDMKPESTYSQNGDVNVLIAAKKIFLCKSSIWCHVLKVAQTG